MIATTHLFSYGGFVISWSSIKQIISATSSNHSKIIVLLWIQPAMIFDIYYRYFNGHGAFIRSSATNDPSRTGELPGLLVLKARDLPLFQMVQINMVLLFQNCKSNLRGLKNKATPKILAYTFDTLEPEA